MFGRIYFLGLGTIRIILLFSVVLCIASVKLNAQNVSVTATAGTTGPSSYATLSAAFAAINSGTHQGTINISIVGNTTEPGLPTALLKSTSPSSYTSITIKPSGGNWTIGGTATANRAIVELNGADNVTIDGDDPSTAGTRNLTIGFSTTATVISAVIRVSSNSATGLDGADNNTIKNCNLVGPRTGVGDITVTYGINMSNYSTTSLSGGGATSINNSFENNFITRCNNGIHCLGLASYPHTGLKIRNNIIGDGTAGGNVIKGIYVSYTASASGQTAAIISGNDIQAGDPGSTSYLGQALGMEINTNNYGIQIFNNNIHDIRKPTGQNGCGAGILVNGATNMNGMSIYNNFIRDIAGPRNAATYSINSGAFGILFTAGANPVSIDHNTIVIKPSTVNATVANNFSAAIMFQVNNVTVSSLRNNIIVNTDTSINAYGIYVINTPNISTATVDKNDYYVDLGKVGYYNAAARATLTDWRAATSKDANSYNFLPSFVSSTDLHINATIASLLESGGATGTGIITDIDGQARPGPAGSVNGGGLNPDVGADEFDGFTVACSALPTLLPASSITNTGAVLNWTAASPAPANGYDYFLSTSSTQPIASATPTGSVAAGVTSVTVGSLTANTIYYFWVRAKCDAVTSSTWAGYSSFTTACNTVTLPVLQGFNVLTIPSCWTQQYVIPANSGSNLTYPISSNNPATTPQEGTNYVYWNSLNQPSGNETRLVSCPINTSGVASVDVQFQWFHDNTLATTSGYADEGFFLEYSTNGTSWTQVGSQITRLGGVNGWNLKTFTLPAGAGNQTLLYVGFRFRSRNGANCSLDAVDIHATPPCSPQPSLLVSSNVLATTATISWTAASPAPASGYDYYVSTIATAPVAATVATGTVAAGVTSVNLTGLTSGTTYYFWVRSRCDASTTSSWTGSSAFTTSSPCTSLPTALTSSAVTATTATISWTAASPAPASGYEYYYSTTNTAPTAATVASGSVGAGIVTANLTGLTGNTTYYFWVRSLCGAGNTSAWTASANFTTACGFSFVTTVASVNETFNTTSPTIPCWLVQANISGTAAAPSLVTSGTNPTTSPQEGDRMIYFNSYSISSGGQSRLISMPLNTSGATSIDVDFYWRNENNTTYTSTTEGVQVQYSTNGGTTWTNIGAFIPRHDGTLAAGTAQWKLKNITIGALGIGTNIRVGFLFTSQFQDNCFLDNVTIKQSPACAQQPSALTSSSITISSANIGWTAASPAPASGYEYYLSTSSVTPASGTAATASVGAGVTGVSLTGLTSNTTYYFWVRSYCNATDKSAWFGPLSFTTLCASFNLPVLQGFNASTMPSCWSQQNVSGTLSFTFPTTGTGTPGPAPQEGTNQVMYNSYSNSTQTRLVSPSIITTGTPSVDVQFQWYHSTNGGATSYLTEGVTVQYSLDKITWVSVGSQILRYNATAGWSLKTVTLPAGAGNQPTIYVGFLFQGNAGYDCYLDAADIHATPACAQQPSALISSSITATSATINWTAASPAPASGYQYYISTSSTAPTNATTPSGSVAAGITTANLTGLSASTTYYFWLRSVCNGIDKSAWFGPISFYTGYCNSTSTGTTYYINSVVTTGGVSNINNVTNAISTNGYGNFTAQTVSNYPGSSINFNVGVSGGGSYGLAIYIDWNNNLSFTDAGERVFTTSSYLFTPLTGSFNVPAGQSTGNYRMRVVANYFSTAPLSCNSMSDGETEDYTFTVLTPSACNSTPTAGTITATPISGTVGSTFTLNASGVSGASGLSYQWQTSADGITWTNITGANTNPYTATAVTTNTTTYYRLVVTCVSLGLSANSNTTTYITTNCIPTYTTACSSLDYIDNFSINSLSNLASGCNGNANNYINYSPAGTLTTSLTQGVSYNANVTIGRGGSGNVAIWVDFNNNGVFETTERFANTTLVPFSGAVTIPVLVPVSAVLGNCKLRVREVYATALASLDPCASYTYGETEDYTITIIANLPCTGTPAPGNTIASQTTICTGSSVNLSLQNLISGSGISYQWQSSSDNVTYGNITGANTNVYSPVVSANTWYRCRVTCSGSNGISTPIQITASTCVIMPSTGNTTATTCSANFYDSGGFLGNYGNNENGTLTIYPSTPGSFVRVTFNSFEIETCCDNLKIYNGNSNAAPLVGAYTTLPGVITSTAADGSLTFVFNSDFSVVATGWEAVISCYTPPPCTGTPAPGNTLATNSYVCTNTSTVLSVANPPSGSLVTYQWQSAPDVAGVPGAFSNIAGAVSPTYSYTPVAAATIWYQCVVTCSGSSTNSNPVQIVAATCTIINMANGSSSTCSARFYDNGGAGGNDNTTSSAGNYGDNQLLTYTIYPSTPGAKVRVSFNSFSVETCCDNLKIYDGNSTASLLLGVFTSSPGTITSSAADGSLTFVFTSDGSINKSGWDATVSCFIPPPCTANLTGGTAASSPSTGAAGSTFTLNATGYSAVSGLTFQWQTSADGITWTTMPGATTIPYTVTAPGVAGVVSTTYYQLLITCPNTNTTVISAPTTFTTASYCIPSHTTSSSAYITKVSFLGTLNDVTNNSTYTTSGYQDFTPLADRAKQAQGEGVNLYIQTTNTAYMNGWADWNNDGVFDATEKIFTSGNISAYSSTFGFVIPLTTPPGNYRIRIRTNTSTGTHDACVNLSNGETEDYLLTVIPTCNIYINGVTNGSICGSGQVTLNVSATAGATTYYWYSLASGGVPLAVTNVPTWTTPVIRSTSYYYVTASNGSCESIVRTAVKAYALSVPVLSFSPLSPAVCGEGAVLRLNATGNNEEAILVNENFENGLGQFTVNTIASSTSATLTQWQIMTSTYLPANTAVWHPAISSGVGSNHFVYSTSDFSGTSLNTALVSPTVNSTNFLNLYMDFSIYYSHYLVDGNTSIPDSILIEASTNNGATWSRVDYYISDQGIGTRFADNTVDLSAFINQPNLKLRIRYFASWCDGVALDDIKIYGNKPLTTLFGWTPYNQNNLFTDSTGLSPYTGGSVPNIYIRPTQAQLDSGANLNFVATATLSNGCSATAQVSVAIIPSQWTGDVSSDWNNINNWCSKIVPTPNTKVEIPAGITRFPVISAPAFAKSIKLNAGTSLTITNTGKLSVYGTMTNAGGNFDAKNGTVELAAATTQSIDSGLFVGNNLRNLIISNDSVKLRGNLNLLNKLSFNGNNRKFVTNGLLTLKSSDTLTAYVADLTNGGTSLGNTITGQVTVERYISSRRAWRLLSSPTQHDLQTIKQAWQEGATIPNSNPLSRFGIQITSNRTSWLADGFDTFSVAGPSMKIYNPVTNLYEGVTSTLAPFIYGKAYMTFIRGDRSVTQLTQSPTSTVIREKGTLMTGTQVLAVGSADSQFVAVANPFASAIDFTKLTRNNISSAFYLWDPALSTYGGYQNCLVSGNTISYAPGGGSYASGNFNIQSGQGFFVRTQGGAGAINFAETSKADGSNLTSRNNNDVSMFRTSLFRVQNGVAALCDGVLNIFDNGFSNNVDADDAIKALNFNENLAILKSEKSLAIETRGELLSTDTVFYKLNQLRLSDYRFVFAPHELNNNLLEAYLIDNYLQTRTRVSLTDSTVFDFTVSNITGSYASDRFMLVFQQMQALPVTFININAVQHSDKTNHINWKVANELNISHYELERSADGNVFASINQIMPLHNNGGSGEYVSIDHMPFGKNNFYRIKAMENNGRFYYSSIVKLVTADAAPEFVISPNPVKNNLIQLSLNNVKIGHYQFEIRNSIGQKLRTGNFLINNPEQKIKIPLKYYLSSGSYLLDISDDFGKHFSRIFTIE